MPLKSEPKRGTIIIIITFGFAIALSIIPLPSKFTMFIPSWPALVLIYWCLAIPHRIGMLTGFIIGLLIDAYSGDLLGQNALSMVVISYLVLSFYQRIRISPLFQQALTVMGLLFLYYLLLFWFDGLPLATEDAEKRPLQYFVRPIGGFVAWFGMFYLLRGIRRKFKIR